MAACLRVLYAGPGVTIQDSGRYGYLRYGVTPAGPIDWAAFETANLALGNDLRAAAIEISVGGLEVIAEGAPLWVAFAGGDFSWARDGEPMPKVARLLLEPGKTLLARAENSGAFAYLAGDGGSRGIEPPALAAWAVGASVAMLGSAGLLRLTGVAAIDALIVTAALYVILRWRTRGYRTSASSADA